jgi:hypothetical protein
MGCTGHSFADLLVTYVHRGAGAINPAALVANGSWLSVAGLT